MSALKTKLLALWIPIGVVAGFLISSVLCAITGFSIFGRYREQPLPTEDANSAALCALAYSILDDIKAGDYAALSLVANPELGIIFSPQSTVSTSTNRLFTAQEIASFGTDSNSYVWGVSSAGGEPIEMTPVEYFDRYVFDRDYTAASYIGVDRIIRSGNALENISEVFPGMRFVEFYVPGDDRDPTANIGWSILRLGFEEYNGSLWLTAVIHSEESA